MSKRWPALKRKQLIEIIETLGAERASCWQLPAGCVERRVALVELDDGREVWCCPKHLAEIGSGELGSTEDRPLRGIVVTSWEEMAESVRALRRDRDERRDAGRASAAAGSIRFDTFAQLAGAAAWDCHLAVELFWGERGLKELDRQDGLSWLMYTPPAGH